MHGGACVVGGMHGRRVVHGRGPCMVGGHAWQGGVHGRGHAWQGGMHGILEAGNDVFL